LKVQCRQAQFFTNRKTPPSWRKEIKLLRRRRENKTEEES